MGGLWEGNRDVGIVSEECGLRYLERGIDPLRKWRLNLNEYFYILSLTFM